MKTVLAPYAAISKWLLDTKDLAVSARLIRRGDFSANEAKPGEIDWAQEETLAQEAALSQATNNDYSMLDSYYQTYVGHRLYRKP